MLLVVGIAGGVPDTDFTLGDVIVSSHIHNFDVNAIKGNETTYDVTGGIHPSISNITASLNLYQRSLAGWNSDASISMPRPYLNLTEKRLKDLLDKNVDEAWREKVEKAMKWHFDRTQRGARAPKFLTGTIASSNTLVRSDAVLAQWLQGARSIRAVEMEVAGVYQAA
jgi:nucleoside phosphorylase